MLVSICLEFGRYALWGDEPAMDSRKIKRASHLSGVMWKASVVPGFLFPNAICRQALVTNCNSIFQDNSYLLVVFVPSYEVKCSSEKAYGGESDPIRPIFGLTMRNYLIPKIS
jgi:hypothetical protein